MDLLNVSDILRMVGLDPKAKARATINEALKKDGATPIHTYKVGKDMTSLYTREVLEGRHLKAWVQAQAKKAPKAVPEAKDQDQDQAILAWLQTANQALATILARKEDTAVQVAALSEMIKAAEERCTAQNRALLQKLEGISQRLEAIENVTNQLA